MLRWSILICVLSYNVSLFFIKAILVTTSLVQSYHFSEADHRNIRYPKYSMSFNRSAEILSVLQTISNNSFSRDLPRLYYCIYPTSQNIRHSTTCNASVSLRAKIHFGVLSRRCGRSRHRHRDPIPCLTSISALKTPKHWTSNHYVVITGSDPWTSSPSHSNTTTTQPSCLMDICFRLERVSLSVPSFLVPKVIHICSSVSIIN